MSEENAANKGENQQQAETATTTQEEKGGEMSLEDYQAALKKAREEAAKYRTERNELREDAQAWREAKEAEKSELEKLQEELQARQQHEKALEVKLTRLSTATKYGIAEENLDLLGTGTAEEIEARAQRLAELQKTQSAPPSNTPREQLGGSKVPPEDSNPPDAYPASWIV